jgi:threonine/homoserine/homoserine lactone efflux protein
MMVVVVVVMMMMIQHLHETQSVLQTGGAAYILYGIT